MIAAAALLRYHNFYKGRLFTIAARAHLTNSQRDQVSESY